MVHYNMHGSFTHSTTGYKNGLENNLVMESAFTIGCPIFSKFFKYPTSNVNARVNIFLGYEEITFFGLNILNEYWMLWELKEIKKEANLIVNVNLTEEDYEKIKFFLIN